jgi:hypothetical protein
MHNTLHILSKLSLLMLLAFGLVACDTDDNPPPTELVIVTPQPTQPIDEEQANLRATIVALEATNAGLLQTLTAQTTATGTSADSQQSRTPSETPQPPPTLTPLPTETPQPSIFPTKRVEVTSVVEQVFEGGRMIWFRDTRQIAVLVGDEVDPQQGDWLCFEDAFTEEEPEFLPTFQPPPDATTTSDREDPRIQQPIRGFGKIWRENPELRERLGWALTSEIEHSPVREYVAGGVVENNDYIPGPGEYRLGTFFENATLVLFEDSLGLDCPNGTWRLRRPQ